MSRENDCEEASCARRMWYVKIRLRRGRGAIRGGKNRGSAPALDKALGLGSLHIVHSRRRETRDERRDDETTSSPPPSLSLSIVPSLSLSPSLCSTRCCTEKHMSMPDSRILIVLVIVVLEQMARITGQTRQSKYDAIGKGSKPRRGSMRAPHHRTWAFFERFCGLAPSSSSYPSSSSSETT